MAPTPLRLRRAATWTAQVAAWVVLLAAVAIVAVAVAVPRLAGATPYSITSGSMSPNLEPGDLIVVRPRAAEDLAVGSVITYQLVSGEPTVATHRIVSMAHHDGEPVFRTQGDANDTPDRGWVRPVQIKGEVWYRAPWLGHLHSALTVDQHQLLANVAAVGLVAYAAVMFTTAWRDRRGSATQPATSTVGEPAS